MSPCFPLFRRQKFVGEVKNQEEWTITLQNRVVVADFDAKWCQPCRDISPFFEKLAGKYQDARFVKIDVDKNEELTTDADVAVMPTFQFYVGGKKVDELLGSDRDTLKELVAKYAGPNAQSPKQPAASAAATTVTAQGSQGASQK